MNLQEKLSESRFPQASADTLAECRSQCDDNIKCYAFEFDASEDIECVHI